ncbi:glutathione S-transferase family protein [Bauldia sp.]|uniref:glutathione S-transferase family protein n=1 Tax=Bauldia sp. TaxID=2575872 RepID=UPI003BA90E21
MSTVEIYGFPPSTYTQTAILAAVEKGAPYSLAPVEFGSPNHRALHPFAKIPVMVHGDVRLYESAAIAVYLDETFDGPGLRPVDPVDRARMWQIATSAVDYFYGPLVRDTLAHMQGGQAPDPAPRDHVLDVLEDLAGQSDYLAGGAVSIADLMVLPMVRFQIGAAEGSDLLASRRNLAAWFERMGERASVKSLEAA